MEKNNYKKIQWNAASITIIHRQSEIKDLSSEKSKLTQ
jgi:hypothetical protein